MPELKKLIEFNFKIDVKIVNDGEYYSEFLKLYGDTKITGNYREDRFDIDYFSDNFAVGTYVGGSEEDMRCKDISSVLLYLKIKYKFPTNSIFLDIPESN